MSVMLARYVPAIDFPAWLRSAAPRQQALSDAREQNIEELGGGQRWATAVEFENARQALRAYFDALPGGGQAPRLSGQTGASVLHEHRSGTVLMPAQICSAAIEAVRLSGHAVRFVDGDGRYPTPSPEQYAAALSDDVVAVVIAPLYGYLQDDWKALVEKLGHRKLVLDFAQGLSMATSRRDLVHRADAIVYSFGLGKGIDTGGGLLLARAEGLIAPGEISSATGFATLANAIALRAVIATGMYSALVGRLEDASETAKEDAASFKPTQIGRGLNQLWREKMARFGREVVLAAERAARVGRSERVRAATRDLDVYTGGEAVRLRQVLRFRSASDRDRILTRLRANGIDCAPAGEPVPAGDFPNARAFVSDAIRLPFLGRLSARQFDDFLNALEASL